MVLISQAETVAILSLTPAAGEYIALVRRPLTTHRRKRGLLYSLAEVHRLAQQRAGQPKFGRPSGRDFLQRRLNRDLRDIVLPGEGCDFPLSGALPPERHFSMPDKGSA